MVSLNVGREFLIFQKLSTESVFIQKLQILYLLKYSPGLEIKASLELNPGLLTHPNWKA